MNWGEFGSAQEMESKNPNSDSPRAIMIREEASSVILSVRSFVNQRFGPSRSCIGE